MWYWPHAQGAPRFGALLTKGILVYIQANTSFYNIHFAVKTSKNDNTVKMK